MFCSFFCCFSMGFSSWELNIFLLDYPAEPGGAWRDFARLTQPWASGGVWGAGTGVQDHVTGHIGVSCCSLAEAGISHCPLRSYRGWNPHLLVCSLVVLVIPGPGKHVLWAHCCSLYCLQISHRCLQAGVFHIPLCNLGRCFPLSECWDTSSLHWESWNGERGKKKPSG